MRGKEFRRARVAADITGDILSVKAGLSRTRLSEIERESRRPTQDEAIRLRKALDDLIDAKQRIEEFAAQVGWPMGA
jgi:transcriptional regulator with XRE-family HTH domain